MAPVPVSAQSQPCEAHHDNIQHGVEWRMRLGTFGSGLSFLHISAGIDGNLDDLGRSGGDLSWFEMVCRGGLWQCAVSQSGRGLSCTINRLC